jgi:glutamine amidotransferase
MIGIIDYGAGNITSVARAVAHLRYDVVLADHWRQLSGVTHVIFPGVGAAGSAMKRLADRGFDRWLTDWAAGHKPLLGICLGAQIITDFSEEDQTPGLGLISGQVRRLPEKDPKSGENFKVPHMGWNQVHFACSHPVLQGIPPSSNFYFVHSYYPEPKEEKNVLAWTDYGIRFSSALAYESMVAVQFHVEKSGPAGLALLNNFCRWNTTNAY